MLIIDIDRWSSVDVHVVSVTRNPQQDRQIAHSLELEKIFEHFCCSGRALSAAHVNVRSQRRFRVPKLISSCSRGQACFVHQSGHGLAEIVARNAIEAGMPKGLAHHLEGVVRVA